MGRRITCDSVNTEIGREAGNTERAASCPPARLSANAVQTGPLKRNEQMAIKRKSHRRTSSRNFEVKAALANSTLTKAKSALTLQIYSKKEKIGELDIGRGSLYWTGAHRQISKRVNWERFAEMMDRLAYGTDA